MNQKLFIKDPYQFVIIYLINFFFECFGSTPLTGYIELITYSKRLSPLSSFILKFTVAVTSMNEDLCMFLKEHLTYLPITFEAIQDADKVLVIGEL